MSVDEARRRLAARQAELVRALVEGGPPAAFDEKRIALAARSLINKRLREVARVWPDLPQALGESYEEHFRNYARQTPPPHEGGPLADGRAFLRTLAAELWSDELTRAAFLVDLRSGWGLRWRRSRGRLLLGVRLPWLGAHWLSARLSLPSTRS